MSLNGKPNNVIEDNILSILDSSIGTKDKQYLNDDRLEFIGAVRAAFLGLVHGRRPSNKIYEEIFYILRKGKSVELIVESHCLLEELGKRFPPLKSPLETEAWSPFTFDSTVRYRETRKVDRSFIGLLDSTDFHNLIKEIAEGSETNFQSNELMSWRNMLVFQYIVNVLRGDLTFRNKMYQETTDWSILRESLLTSLLSSRSIRYKTLIMDLVSLLCGMWQMFSLVNADTSTHRYENWTSENGVDISEASYCVRQSITHLFMSIMELDALKKNADELRFTSRADNVRTPLMEIIIDELTYDKDMVSPFLQAFDEPKWKLEIVLLYFSKYNVKSVRTRRSCSSTTEEFTFSWMMGFFSNITSTKSLTKKIGSYVVQVLLAHALQAQLSLLAEQQNCTDQSDNNNVEDVCNSFLSAFRALKQANGAMEISPSGRQALFTATAILSSRS